MKKNTVFNIVRAAGNADGRKLSNKLCSCVVLRLIVIFVFAVMSFCISSYAKDYYHVISSDPLNVREKPSANSEVVDVLLEGEEVILLEKKGDWRFVRLENGNVGYVYYKYIKYIHTEVDPDEQAEIDKNQDSIFLVKYHFIKDKDGYYKGAWRFWGIIALVFSLAIVLLFAFAIENKVKWGWILTGLSELLATGGALAVFAGFESFWDGYLGYFIGLVILLIPFVIIYINSEFFVRITEQICCYGMDYLRKVLYIGSCVTAIPAALCAAFDWSFGNFFAKAYVVILALCAFSIIYRGFSNRNYFKSIQAAIIYFISGVFIMVSLSVYFCVSLFCVLVIIILFMLTSSHSDGSPTTFKRGYIQDDYGHRIEGTFYNDSTFSGDDGVVYYKHADRCWKPHT